MKANDPGKLLVIAKRGCWEAGIVDGEHSCEELVEAETLFHRLEGELRSQTLAETQQVQSSPFLSWTSDYYYVVFLLTIPSSFIEQPSDDIDLESILRQADDQGLNISELVLKVAGSEFGSHPDSERAFDREEAVELFLL